MVRSIRGLKWVTISLVIVCADRAQSAAVRGGWEPIKEWDHEALPRECQ